MKLKGNNSSFEIKLITKSNPNSIDEWDRKWINSELEILLLGFKANQSIEILYDDLICFYESIKNALNDFSKTIIFSNIEESVYLEGKIETNGQVLWNGFNIYPIGDGNKLIFKFETELAQIDKLFVDIKKALNEFS